MNTDEAPTPPEPNDCCGNGCELCVWDLYYEELRQWQAQQKAGKDTDNSVKTS